MNFIPGQCKFFSLLLGKKCSFYWYVRITNRRHLFLGNESRFDKPCGYVSRFVYVSGNLTAERLFCTNNNWGKHWCIIICIVFTFVFPEIIKIQWWTAGGEEKEQLLKINISNMVNLFTTQRLSRKRRRNKSTDLPYDDYDRWLPIAPILFVTY